MLRRIYIDNHKCLQNFELKLGPINLFLGPNGGGKSTVFDVIRKLQIVIGGEGKINDIFEYSDKTKWQNMPFQNFELEIEKDLYTWRYELSVDMSGENQPTKVNREKLFCDNKPLLIYQKGEVQLYFDDSSPGPKYPFDLSQSAIGSIGPSSETKLLNLFKEQIKKFLVVQINPKQMVPVSTREERHPTLWLDNFVSWYRFLSQDQGFAFQLTKALQEVLPGFDYFKFLEIGEKHRELQVYFNNSIAYNFAELSDGQRILIGLYSLLHVAREKGFILFIDEPENFIALPEIQPWLIELYDLCSQRLGQAIIISHHPEIMNYLLASPIGFWFDRPSNGGVRVKQIGSIGEEGMPISEIIARGWVHE